MLVPKMKKVLAVGETNTNDSIWFWADEKLAKAFSNFGHLRRDGKDKWELEVDLRYSFIEIEARLRAVENGELSPEKVIADYEAEETEALASKAAQREATRMDTGFDLFSSTESENPAAGDDGSVA